MKLQIIKEPPLEFGKGMEICPRAGITRHDVYDTRHEARRERIHVGAVGTTESLEKFHKWLDRCSRPISGTGANERLSPTFCGFNTDSGFKARLIVVDEITRSLNRSEVKRILDIKDHNKRIDEAVELYYRQVEFLARHRPVDVITCIIPNQLFDKIAKEEPRPLEEVIDDSSDPHEFNFRRALKAKSMHLGRPLQLLREQSLEVAGKGQQDDATKAWNLCTALYYKASQTVPWKLVANINRPAVCFAGIGFYRSRDRKTLHTSLAQVFDELGNGVILRGTPVELGKKDDRVPHLSAEQSYTLLTRALREYETALNTSPGRLVLHKSSNFDVAELDGFRQATREARVRSVDFVTILDAARLRVLRHGIYPPYRGTHIELDERDHLLYTRGSVPHYQTYPGKYPPQALEIRIIDADESPTTLCSEILSLTKMNWNNTQFDRKYPITIECARKVGLIMKYLDPERDPEPQISYAYYM